MQVGEDFPAGSGVCGNSPAGRRDQVHVQFMKQYVPAGPPSAANAVEDNSEFASTDQVDIQVTKNTINVDSV